MRNINGRHTGTVRLSLYFFHVSITKLFIMLGLVCVVSIWENNQDLKTGKTTSELKTTDL